MGSTSGISTALQASGGPRLGGRLYWSLRREVEALAPLGDEGEGVTVAILDGAFDRSHPAFAQAKLQPGFSTSRTGQDTTIEHGTAVTSLILGRGPMGGGLAPKATGIPIKIFAGDGHVGVLPCSQTDLAVALEAAIAAEADIINVSGGGFEADGTPLHRLARALAACADAGVAVIAAAGNDGCACPHVPAASPSVLAVGALGDDGHPLASSNWSEAYRGHGVAAPGDRLPAARAKGGWSEWSGTSFAAALTSGLAARLLAGARRYRPELRGADVVAALLLTARRLESPAQRDRALDGVLDPRAALERLTAAQGPLRQRAKTSQPGATPQAVSLAPSGQRELQDGQVYAVGLLAIARAGPRGMATAEPARGAPSPETQSAVRERRVFEPGWTWSLTSGGRPTLTICLEGPFVRETTAWLIDQIQRQWAGEACRLALAGRVVEIDLDTGLPSVRPDRLGLAAWPRTSQPLARMARDTGRLGHDRALNFALTRLAAPTATSPLQPAGAEVLPAALGQPDQHEAVVSFFDPMRRLSAGRRIWRATIDVSDVLPVFVDSPHEYWTA